MSNTLKQSIDPGRQSRDGPLAVNDNERELDLISVTFINQKKTPKAKTETFPNMFLYDVQGPHKKNFLSSLGITSSK